MFSLEGPKETYFMTSDGEIAQFYFKNNPWKPHLDLKIYRFCIVCGINRFPIEEWSRSLKDVEYPFTCKKMTCTTVLPELYKYVPRHLLSVPQQSVKLSKEFYETVESVTFSNFDEKVFSDESEMPSEYIDIFKKLESTPIHQRIFEIDKLYFEYCERNRIVISESTDMSEKFLSALLNYRKQCLHRLHYRQDFLKMIKASRCKL